MISTAPSTVKIKLSHKSKRKEIIIVSVKRKKWKGSHSAEKEKKKKFTMRYVLGRKVKSSPWVLNNCSFIIM